MKLTTAQSLILRDLQTMPKRRRTPSGLVEYNAVEHFDMRSFNGLVSKGFVDCLEHGIHVSSVDTFRKRK